MEEVGVVHLFINTGSDPFITNDSVLLTGDAVLRSRFGFDVKPAGDLNKDNIEDFFISGMVSLLPGCGVIYVFLGAQTYDASYTYSEKIFPSNCQSNGLITGFGANMFKKDFNSDGHTDLVVANLFEGKALVYLKRPKAGFDFSLKHEAINVNSDLFKESRIQRYLSVCASFVTFKDIAVKLTLSSADKTGLITFDSNSQEKVVKWRLENEQDFCKVVVYYLRIGLHDYEAMAINVDIEDNTYEENVEDCKDKVCPVIYRKIMDFKPLLVKQCDFLPCSYSVSMILKRQIIFITHNLQETHELDLEIINDGAFLGPFILAISLPTFCAPTVKSTGFKVESLPFSKASIQVVHETVIESGSQLTFAHKLSCVATSHDPSSFRISYLLHEIILPATKFTKTYDILIKYAFKVVIYTDANQKKQVKQGASKEIDLEFKFEMAVEGNSVYPNFELSSVVEAENPNVELLEWKLKDDEENTISACRINNRKVNNCQNPFISFRNLQLEYTHKFSFFQRVKVKLTREAVVTVSLAPVIVSDLYVNEDDLSTTTAKSSFRIIPTVGVNKKMLLIIIVSTSAGALLVLILVVAVALKLKLHRKLFPVDESLAPEDCEKTEEKD